MGKNSVLTELDKRILQIGERDGIREYDKILMIGAVLAIHEYGLEKDVQDYLDKNPNASFMELDDYIISLCPPLEIVDDDELDDEQE